MSITFTRTELKVLAEIKGKTRIKRIGSQLPHRYKVATKALRDRGIIGVNTEGKMYVEYQYQILVNNNLNKL